MKIILLGPPASGKGTVGKKLSSKTGLPLISVGKLLREIPVDSIWYEPIQEAMNKGELASNSIVGGFLAEITKDSRYENGYILDGWARQESDLDHFDPEPDIVVNLDISFEISWQRVSARRVCEEGSHTYNLVSHPPKKEGICDVDGSRLVSRVDDTLDVLQQRWKIFKESTLPVIKNYNQQGVLVTVPAEGGPEEVFEKVKAQLNI